MNEANNTSTYQEFVWRRLSEPLTIRGHDFPSWLWLVILGMILLTGLFYIVWMYVKDSSGVGPWWAIFLGTLRACVYVLLAVVFLLPAKQTWEETRVMGKVLVLVDTSPSLTKVMDDIPTGRGDDKLQTRQDKVVAFLAKDGNKFLTELQAKNPASLFRFASRLDENYMLLKDGRNWTREEWEEYLRNADRNVELPEAKPMPAEYLRAWLNPGAKIEAPVEWGEAERARLQKLEDMTQKLGDAGYFAGTNLGSAALSLVNRELNDRVQGIVIITDGRSTEGSPKMFGDIETRAKSARIPIFVVGVGQERPQVKIDVVDLRVPEQVQPEDKFRAVVELQGEGLPDKPVKVFLDITHTIKDKNGKDVDLDLTLTEQVNKNNPEEKRAKLSLGTKKLTLEPSVAGEVRSQLAAAGHGRVRHRRAVAGQGGPHRSGIEGSRRQEVGADRDERGRAAFPRAGAARSAGSVRRAVSRHRTGHPARRQTAAARAGLHQRRHPRLSVPALHPRPRDGQETRRSVDLHAAAARRQRAEAAASCRTCRPNGCSASSRRAWRPATRKIKLYALDQYDVIVAFDPDWTQLSESQLKMVGRWVENGGGLIAVGGPINTLELARPKSHAAKLKPILDLYPVVLSDIRISDFDRDTKEPWPLDFTGATPDMEFLKLDESDEAKFLTDWDAFFYGADGKKGSAAVRGFYSYYPVEKAKTTAVVVARFTDPKGKLKDNSLQPYIVTTSPSSNRRVVWLGSGEIWRLRSFSVSYHERFWTKLLRYAGSNNMSRVNKRIRLYMGSTHVANKPIEFEGKFEGKEGEPLAPGPKAPTVKLSPPPGVAETVVPKPFEMKAKPNGEGWFSGRFQVRAAGDYTLTVKNPETGDTLTHRFSVKEANPEMDNTRPDFQTMYELASEADDVLGRMGDAERQELKRSLQRPKMEGAAQNENKDDKVRLYFDLKNAHLIPTCMRPDVQTLRNRGPIAGFMGRRFRDLEAAKRRISPSRCRMCCWPLSACCHWNG